LYLLDRNHLQAGRLSRMSSAPIEAGVIEHPVTHA
jgi:hypothetical protein